VAAAGGAAAADIRQLELFPSIPGTSRLSPTRRTMEATSVEAHRDEMGRLWLSDSDYFARDVAAGILPPGSAYQ
jgi:hypothetical protein